MFINVSAAKVFFFNIITFNKVKKFSTGFRNYSFGLFNF